MDDKKIKDAFKELEKKLCDLGYEDFLRQQKFKSMLQILGDGDFKRRDCLVLYILLDEEEPRKYLSKLFSYIRTSKENLDEISIKDLKNHLLKIGDFEK